MKTITPISSEAGEEVGSASHTPTRVCVVCRVAHPRTTLVRLVRRPGGRIGWPENVTCDPSDTRNDAEGAGQVSSDGEANERMRRGARMAPTGKGLYVCRGGDCLARLIREKRFKRMFADAMEEACMARLSEMLGPSGERPPSG